MSVSIIRMRLRNSSSVNGGGAREVGRWSVGEERSTRLYNGSEGEHTMIYPIDLALFVRDILACGAEALICSSLPVDGRCNEQR